ncbi:MAG: hypothetical protein AUJ51_05995 [Elusimicrobia bacterium CG1_02_56_21]|nr:MAG: hypothetical protein AUJ51_05995 [Elusimicrobia bacterium CG1_02_56_21]
METLGWELVRYSDRKCAFPGLGFFYWRFSLALFNKIFSRRRGYLDIEFEYTVGYKGGKNIVFMLVEFLKEYGVGYKKSECSVLDDSFYPASREP